MHGKGPGDLTGGALWVDIRLSAPRRVIDHQVVEAESGYWRRWS